MPLDAPGHLSSVQLQALREQLQSRLLWRSLELDRLLAELRDHTGSDGERTALYAEITLAEADAAELHEALERMATGDYGRCQDCGAPIAFARLKLRPLTRRCPRCAPEAAG
ncbi:TraR/DksA family transcriptional regulator [Thermomonospora catenispora]|uniref:TraR/DksA family transcriptional regulator n=1 Tax=Thermomonospora catenispora TaxID=2493090 RepID=UPI00111F38AF|nr:TraR/DksA C4-type zinc finger protein [Thermomonospora catenispora]TNY38598.1 TraR/DksA family transcriptional regulator [Thermomonospora catenispora]